MENKKKSSEYTKKPGWENLRTEIYGPELCGRKLPDGNFADWKFADRNLRTEICGRKFADEKFADG